MLLAALWVLGRVVMWGQGLWSDALPYGVVVLGDMAFVVALAGVVARPLLDPQHRRQLVFVPILLCLFAANLLFHFEGLGLAVLGVDWLQRGVMLGLDAIIVVIAVVGGRVTPSFTSSFICHGDPNVKVRQSPVLDRFVMAATWALLVVDLVWPERWLGGLVAFTAAGLHLARLAGWQSLRTLGNPILWVLHLGYVWLVLGLMLKGTADFGLLDQVDALHALTIGAIGTMTLAIMTRAWLGHTVRTVKGRPVVVVAFGLVGMAALLCLAVLAWPDMVAPLVISSGVAWILAFAAFVAVYAPILTRPRVDGRPG